MGFFDAFEFKEHVAECCGSTSCAGPCPDCGAHVMHDRAHSVFCTFDRDMAEIEASLASCHGSEVFDADAIDRDLRLIEVEVAVNGGA
jgi:hypothetical protein